MKAFAELYRRLDETTSTNGKIEAITRHTIINDAGKFVLQP